MKIKVIIKDPVGLHARPASVIVQEATKFQSEMIISIGEKSGNLKSIMSLMALGIKCGEEITIEAKGKDAEKALEALEIAMKKSDVI